MSLESNVLIERYSIFNALVWFLYSVLSDMFIKSSFHRESLVTMYILIWCLPNVHHHVDYELIILSESLVTLDRLKRSFSRVFLLMVYGRCLSWKSLVSMVTLIRFIYWMSLWVSFQINFLKEILITLIALILPLSCVFSHMNFYWTLLMKALLHWQQWNGFFSSVYPHMGLQSIIIRKSLVTLITLICNFLGMCH